MKKVHEKLTILVLFGFIAHSHRMGVSAGMGAIVDILEGMNTVHDAFLKFTTASTDDIMNKAEELSQSLNSWGGRIEAKLEQSINKLLNRIPLMGEIADEVRLLNDYIGRIDQLYIEFIDYVENPDHYTNISLDDLLHAFTAEGGDSVGRTITALHHLVDPQRLAKWKKSIFLLLAQETQVMGMELCDTESTPQQRLVDIYSILMESELKASSMLDFGFVIKGSRMGVNVTPDIERAQARYKTRARGYLKLLRSTMHLATRKVRRCDPPGGHKRAETFYEFSKFLQGYLIQEDAFMNDDYCGGSNGGHCASQAGTGKSAWPAYHKCDGLGCDNDGWRCAGRLTGCTAINGRVDICYLSDMQSRRYAWFLQQSESFLAGDDTNGCPGTLRSADKYKYKVYSNICKVCRCICVEDTPPKAKSLHYIHLRERLSDVANNKVITGVSLKLINGIAQIMIQESTIAPEAQVTDDKPKWVEPEYVLSEEEGSEYAFFKWDEHGPRNNRTYVKVDLELDKDIAVLTWDNRRIHLDEITLPWGYVLTGVSFDRLKDESKKPIQLRIRGTRYDDVKGELNADDHVWVTPDDMYYSKHQDRMVYTWSEEEIKAPLDGTKTLIDTTPYAAVDIGWTSFKWDAAQTVIPLLDALEVSAEPRVPIVSLGLYHKSDPGYGGFLTFVIEGMDQAPYLPTEP